MSNIAEGFERNRLGEFHQFLSTAKASCAELRTQLYVAVDAGYLDEKVFKELLAQARAGGCRIRMLEVWSRIRYGVRRKRARQPTVPHHSEKTFLKKS
jgi:hypothetical protein